MPEVRLIDSETLKSRIGELCINNEDMFPINAYKRIIGVIESMPTEPKVNRAEILRLCNDIEDCISEAWALFKIETCDYDLIHEKLQAIGKELNGDA